MQSQNCQANMLEEFFTCPICLEIMQNPTTTNCGHNFCLNCIKMNNYECAICRKISDYNMTVNYGLKKSIEFLKEEKKKKEIEEVNSKNRIIKNQNELTQRSAERNISNCPKLRNCSRSITSLSLSENTTKYRVKRIFREIDCFKDSNNSVTSQQDSYINNLNSAYSENNYNFVNPQQQNIDTLLDRIMQQFKQDPYVICNPKPIKNNFTNLNINVYNVAGNVNLVGEDILYSNQNSIYNASPSSELTGDIYQSKKMFKR